MADWISKAIKRPGQLHKDLGIPEGDKIPLSTLKAAAKRKDKTGQRARLALTMRGFSHESRKKAAQSMTEKGSY